MERRPEPRRRADLSADLFDVAAAIKKNADCEGAII
jgi:hypothetical protein